MKERRKTTIKALGLSGGYGGAPCSVDYKEGKIIRIRPLHFDGWVDNTWKNVISSDSALKFSIFRA